MLAGFRWIIPSALAGSALPGLLNDLELDLDFLAEHGISRIVSLTTRPLADPDRFVARGFELIHFPIADMGIPTPRSCAVLCARLVEDLESRPVLLHCRGGLGRTGTIAACCLVNLGYEPEEALRRVRGVNANYVQTSAQARFIDHYAESLGA
ncbi:MAG: tyrosine-protein phosphatase [Myxococcales bacterium]|nr:tyrosine-protein phosphatase [Myxococcales bacterium]MCA9698578.1 tyrosine-protein phosphatase [Myxococcales bacterium]